jgi:hypothetical protein
MDSKTVQASRHVLSGSEFKGIALLCTQIVAAAHRIFLHLHSWHNRGFPD